MTKKDDPTPLQTATITAEKMIRAPLGQLIAALIFVVSATFWATCVWRDVQDLKRDVAEVKAAVRELVPSRATVSSNGPQASEP